MKRKVRPTDYARMYESGAFFTAFDTETTGLNAAYERVIEIGAVKFNKGGISGTFSILIQPQRSVPPGAFKVHGISDRMLKDAPVFAEAAPDFLHFIEGTRLVAHNAGFDIGFINAELTRSGFAALDAPLVPAADTVYLAQKAFPQLEKHNLQFLAQHFSIPPGTAHRALDDALVCREVFLRCIAEYRKNRSENDTLKKGEQQ